MGNRERSVFDVINRNICDRAASMFVVKTSFVCYACQRKSRGDVAFTV